MSHLAGTREPYAAVPAHVARWVEFALGSPVVGVDDVVGGMSPGPVARLKTESGRAAFVKACGSQINPKTPGLLRDEAKLLSAAPAHPVLPVLLDVYDDGDWVALLIEYIVGEMPGLPWDERNLRRAAELLHASHEAMPGVDASFLKRADESSPILMDRWKALVDDRSGLDPWWSTNVDRLMPHAERAAALIAGDELLHWDVRADNMLFSADRDVLVDWGQARRGPLWVDHALLAIDTSLSGSHVSTLEAIALDPVLAERGPQDVLALAAAASMSWMVTVRTNEASMPAIVDLSRRWAANLQPFLAEALDHV